MYCGSVVVGICGLQGLSLLIHGVIPVLDAVGEYLRFILFLDDLYGRMSNRVFPETMYVDFYKYTEWWQRGALLLYPECICGRQLVT